MLKKKARKLTPKQKAKNRHIAGLKGKKNPKQQKAYDNLKKRASTPKKVRQIDNTPGKKLTRIANTKRRVINTQGLIGAEINLITGTRAKKQNALKIGNPPKKKSTGNRTAAKPSSTGVTKRKSTPKKGKLPRAKVTPVTTRSQKKKKKR